MTIVLVLLILTPLISLITRSFVTLEAARGERGQVQTGFTLRYYQELFQNRTGSLFYVPPITAVRNSLVYAALTVVIAIVLGLLGAYALNQPWKVNRILEPFFMLPLGASAVTLGLGFLVASGSPLGAVYLSRCSSRLRMRWWHCPWWYARCCRHCVAFPAPCAKPPARWARISSGCFARWTYPCSYGHCW